jgi:threonine 3-dehydrogenase
MYETWFQMEALLKSGKLDLSPVITHRLPMHDFAQCMQLLKSGEASKIVLYPDK